MLCGYFFPLFGWFFILFHWSPLTSTLSGRDEEPSLHRQACVKRNQGLTSQRAGGPWGQGDTPPAETSLRDATCGAGMLPEERCPHPSEPCATNRRQQTQAELPEDSVFACDGREGHHWIFNFAFGPFSTLSHTVSPITCITLCQQGERINTSIVWTIVQGNLGEGKHF